MVVSCSNFYADYENEIRIYLWQTITVLENNKHEEFCKKNCGYTQWSENTEKAVSRKIHVL